MAYNEAGQELSLADAFEGRRKLRPLVPRPFLSHANTNVNTTSCPRFHGPDIFPLHHNHHNTGEEGNNNETSTQQIVVSSRWNPTPEQLRALEELYQCGTRTPSAEQIQHITAQLRRYGKIEGKNVFYWFQNHKARERQKRRRQVQLSGDITHPRAEIECIEITRNDEAGSGTNRVNLEAEQAKSLSWSPSSNLNLHAQESESDPPIDETVQKPGAVNVSPSRGDGWIQFDAREFQHQNYSKPRTNILRERNATWQLLVQPSSKSSPNYSLINNHHCCPLPLPPTTPTTAPISLLSLNSKLLDLDQTHEEGERKSLTLDLFPLVKADSWQDDDTSKDRESPVEETGGDQATIEDTLFPYYKFI